jgi:hypothetical protein
MLKRFLPSTGMVGLLSIGLTGVLSIGLAGTVAAAGGGGCSGGSGSTTLSSSQVFASRVSGLFANAAFSSVSGTTETDVFIDAGNGSFAQSGTESTSTSGASVDISVFDTVTGIPSVEAFGFTPNPNFQIDRNLTSATLGPTAITVCNFLSPVPSTSVATVDATWIGVGSATQSVSTSTFHSGKFTITDHMVGFSRSAQATGSVSDAALNVSIDGSAVFAELDSVKSGTVAVCVGTTCK